MLPFVNCTSLWDVWSALINVNTTPFESGVIFLSVEVSFTSWAVPVGVNAPLSLNLICMLETSTSNWGESIFACPFTPLVAPTGWYALVKRLIELSATDVLLLAWRIQKYLLAPSASA